MIRTPANGHLDGHGRALMKALVSPHPLGAYLPALYQEDEFAQRWTSGLDVVLAPIFHSMDNIEAYLDPRLAPADFLDWLASWMGLVADETWPVERRRAFVSQAGALYRMRGTTRGLAEHVRLFTGGEVEILERGGTAWSAKADAALPGSSGFDFVVRVRAADSASIDTARVDALVAAAKPAHLTHRVEVVVKEPAAKPRRPRPAATEAPSEPQDQPPSPSNGEPHGDATPPEQTE